MTRLLVLLPAALFFSGAATPLPAQAPADSALAAYIATIKAIDSHAHPMRFVANGAPADSEYDALPLDGIPPFQLPWRLRLENPQWRDAQRALFGVTTGDTGAAYREQLARAKARVAGEQGVRFPAWVLDRTGIDVMLANRIVLGAGLAPPRFRWVPFADPLMLPLDGRLVAARTPDTRVLYPRESALLRRYLADAGVPMLPPTLDAYVKKVVLPTLESQRRGGAVAVKFEAAYLRALDFDPPNVVAARAVYARYAAAGAPSPAEYKVLQDHLFRVICREAGRLGMAVQVHVLEGFGGFYSAAGAAPHALESVLNDSTLRATNFVLVHGGWPLVDETQVLLAKPNVYADISAMVLIVEPARLAQVLRQWLAEWPEKVLFGTDAFDGGPDQGWAEVAWVGATTGRGALTAALSGMLRAGEIDRARAETVARMVLRENAIEVYRLGQRAP
jgi:predicted TIM-barrel fold metal-dependent hydrolase